MKINSNKAFHKIILFAYCFYGYGAYAEDPEVPDEPPLEDAPIDGNIMILLVIAVLFGIYVIYKYKLNKKRLI
ncbi:hypothetical protein [Flavobacterium sp. 5]|uniref:hypothetical protein n=1 Tax=Flavobacterium sp. 5 TaxID=2035199 RepID=UPI000C2C0F5F|nr:hypothetical protein [Flavobacterium sp. 5]PKB16956.1 hypothetical protein CLU82_2115 [Flavobacterium sp. 5]